MPQPIRRRLEAQEKIRDMFLTPTPVVSEGRSVAEDDVVSAGEKRPAVYSTN
ncbi:MAG TPA: hypothetical protein VFV58_08740 [Blastocatellia bacterium]|jgi:hypothetical protein|nr:hypothetical protein [Blastocatellia bacterium]